MPVVFRDGRRVFHFYANEGDPREPAHIHVDGPDGRAKFWLRPEVHAAYVRGYDARTARRLIALADERRAEIEQAWNEFFDDADRGR